MAEENEGQETGGTEEEAPKAIKVGEKEYTPDQIAALEQTAGVGGKLQELADRYGVPPEQFLEYSNNSLGIVSELQSRGMLDEEGGLKISQEPSGRSSEPRTPSVPQPPPQNDPASKALDAINQRFDKLEEGLSTLYKGRVMDTVRTVSPDFTDDDVALIAREANRTKRPVTDVARDIAQSRKAREDQIREEERKRIAEEYQLDFDQLNRVKELGSDGGLTPAKVVGGKRLSMRGGKDSVTPKKALFDYLGAKQQVK